MRGFVVVLLGAFAVGCGSDASGLFAVQNVGDASVDVLEDEDMAEDAGLEDASLEDGGIVADSGDEDAGLEDDASDGAACATACPGLDASPEAWEQPCCIDIKVYCDGPGRYEHGGPWQNVFGESCIHQCVDGRWKKQECDHCCKTLTPW